MSAAALLGVSAFAAGIESANVVGYNHNALTNGFTMVAPMFNTVGSNGVFHLSDLVVAGYTVGSCAGDVNIQLLDKSGKTVKNSSNVNIKYYWQDNEDFDAVGWYDGNGTAVDATNIAFDVGTAVWVAAINGAYVTIAGQVGTSDVAVSLNAGFTATGNMMPYTMKLSQMTVSGYAAGSCAGDVNIQLLDKSGKTVKNSSNVNIKYYWQDNEDFDAVGWYDGNGTAVDADSITFAPGQGLWVAGITGTYLHFPAPTL